MRYGLLFLSAILLPAPSGLSGAQVSRDERGPRVRPDENEWRRRSVPLPPLYMDFKTGRGDQWTMVTPLYWQVEGGSGSHYHLFPLVHYAADASSGASRGHVLNYWWADGPGGKDYSVLFPVYWSFRRQAAETSLYGPLYVKRENGGEHRRRTVLMPWLYSRERDDTGYDYWGVLFRLVGFEKQVMEGVERERLWLFFVFKLEV